MPTSGDFWIVFYTAPWLLKKLWLLIDHFDSPAFRSPLAHQPAFSAPAQSQVRAAFGPLDIQLTSSSKARSSSLRSRSVVVVAVHT